MHVRQACCTCLTRNVLRPINTKACSSSLQYFLFWTVLETLLNMGRDTHHKHQHHTGHEHVCSHKMSARGITLMLCFGLTCAEPVLHRNSCSGASCRTLSAEEATSFVSWLGDESPVEHILELYQASGSTDDLSAWLLQSRYEIIPQYLELVATHRLPLTRVLFMYNL